MARRLSPKNFFDEMFYDSFRVRFLLSMISNVLRRIITKYSQREVRLFSSRIDSICYPQMGCVTSKQCTVLLQASHDRGLVEKWTNSINIPNLCTTIPIFPQRFYEIFHKIVAHFGFVTNLFLQEVAGNGGLCSISRPTSLFQYTNDDQSEHWNMARSCDCADDFVDEASGMLDRAQDLRVYAICDSLFRALFRVHNETCAVIWDELGKFRPSSGQHVHILQILMFSKVYARVCIQSGHGSFWNLFLVSMLNVRNYFSHNFF